MQSLRLKHEQKSRRINRIRSKVYGTEQRPRLVLIISNQHVFAQIINDDTSSTLVSDSSLTLKNVKSLSDKAAAVGESITKKAKAKKIDTVVFDRRGRQYHGRVKAFADAARAAGMEF